MKSRNIVFLVLVVLVAVAGAIWLRTQIVKRDGDTERPARPIANLRLLPDSQGPAFHEFRIEHIENTVAGKDAENPVVPVKGERLTLAKIQQAGDMVDVGIRQHH